MANLSCLGDERVVDEVGTDAIWKGL